MQRKTTKIKHGKCEASSTLSTFKNAHISKAINLELVDLLLNIMWEIKCSCFNKARLGLLKIKKINWHPKNIFFGQKLDMALQFKSHKKNQLNYLKIYHFSF